MTVYFNHYHAPTKQYVGVAIIAYFWKVIIDYYERHNSQKYFLKNIRLYCDNLGVRREYYLQNAFLPYHNTIKLHPFQYRLPFANKITFYSLFVSPIENLIHHEYYIRKNQVYLNNLIEIITPIGWLTTGVTFYDIISCWIETSIPNKHLTVKIVYELVNENGVLICGSGQRCPPSCNEVILLIKILKTNKIIFDTIIEANEDNEIQYGKVQKKLTENCYYYGDSAAQNITSILAILGLLNKPLYASKAKIAKGTTMAKNIQRYSI